MGRRTISVFGQDGRARNVSVDDSTQPSGYIVVTGPNGQQYYYDPEYYTENVALRHAQRAAGARVAGSPISSGWGGDALSTMTAGFGGLASATGQTDLGDALTSARASSPLSSGFDNITPLLRIINSIVNPETRATRDPNLPPPTPPEDLPQWQQDLTLWGRRLQNSARARYSPELLADLEQPGLQGGDFFSVIGESAPSTLPIIAAGGLAALTRNPAALSAARPFFGTIEGLQSYGGTRDSVYQTIRQFAIDNPEEFANSPIGRRALEIADGDRLKAIRIASNEAMGSMDEASAVAVGLLGGIGNIAGGIQRAVSRTTSNQIARRLLGSIGGRAVEEGAEELLQSPTEQLAQNLAVGQIDPSVRPTDNLVDSAILGLVAGAAGGAGFGIGEQGLQAITTPRLSNEELERAADREARAINSEYDREGDVVFPDGTVPQQAPTPATPPEPATAPPEPDVEDRVAPLDIAIARAEQSDPGDRHESEQAKFELLSELERSGAELSEEDVTELMDAPVGDVIDLARAYRDGNLAPQEPEPAVEEPEPAVGEPEATVEEPASELQSTHEQLTNDIHNWYQETQNSGNADPDAWADIGNRYQNLMNEVMYNDPDNANAVEQAVKNYERQFSQGEFKAAGPVLAMNAALDDYFSGGLGAMDSSAEVKPPSEEAPAQEQAAPVERQFTTEDVYTAVNELDDQIEELGDPEQFSEYVQSRGEPASTYAAMQRVLLNERGIQSTERGRPIWPDGRRTKTREQWETLEEARLAVAKKEKAEAEAARHRAAVGRGRVEAPPPAPPPQQAAPQRAAANPEQLDRLNEAYLRAEMGQLRNDRVPQNALNSLREAVIAAQRATGETPNINASPAVILEQARKILGRKSMAEEAERFGADLAERDAEQEISRGANHVARAWKEHFEELADTAGVSADENVRKALGRRAVVAYRQARASAETAVREREAALPKSGDPEKTKKRSVIDNTDAFDPRHSRRARQAKAMDEIHEELARQTAEDERINQFDDFTNRDIYPAPPKNEKPADVTTVTLKTKPGVVEVAELLTAEVTDSVYEGGPEQTMPAHAYYVVTNEDGSNKRYVRRDVFEQTRKAIKGKNKYSPTGTFTAWIAQTDGVVKTLENPEGDSYKAGSYIMEGAVGENWAQKPEKVKAKFEVSVDDTAIDPIALSEQVVGDNQPEQSQDEEVQQPETEEQRLARLTKAIESGIYTQGDINEIADVIRQASESEDENVRQAADETLEKLLSTSDQEQVTEPEFEESVPSDMDFFINAYRPGEVGIEKALREYRKDLGNLSYNVLAETASSYLTPAEIETTPRMKLINAIIKGTREEYADLEAQALAQREAFFDPPKEEVAAQETDTAEEAPAEQAAEPLAPEDTNVDDLVEKLSKKGAAQTLQSMYATDQELPRSVLETLTKIKLGSILRRVMLDLGQIEEGAKVPGIYKMGKGDLVNRLVALAKQETVLGPSPASLQSPAGVRGEVGRPEEDTQDTPEAQAEQIANAENTAIDEDGEQINLPRDLDDVFIESTPPYAQIDFPFDPAINEPADQELSREMKRVQDDTGLTGEPPAYDNRAHVEFQGARARALADWIQDHHAENVAETLNSVEGVFERTRITDVLIDRQALTRDEAREQVDGYAGVKDFIKETPDTYLWGGMYMASNKHPKLADTIVPAVMNSAVLQKSAIRYLTTAGVINMNRQLQRLETLWREGGQEKEVREAVEAYNKALVTFATYANNTLTFEQKERLFGKNGWLEKQIANGSISQQMGRDIVGSIVDNIGFVATNETGPDVGPIPIHARNYHRNKAAMQKVLTEEMSKLGLSDVGARVVDVIEAGNGQLAPAGYYAKLVLVSMNDPDIDFGSLSEEEAIRLMHERVNHEVVHAMRHMGLITDSEWSNLKRYSRQYGASPNQTFFNEVQQNYQDFYVGRSFRNQIIEEEAIAVASQHQNDKVIYDKPAKTLLGIRLSYSQFFGNSASIYNNARQIFESMQSGEIGARRRNWRRGFENSGFALNRRDSLSVMNMYMLGSKVSRWWKKNSKATDLPEQRDITPLRFGDPSFWNGNMALAPATRRLIYLVEEVNTLYAENKRLWNSLSADQHQERSALLLERTNERDFWFQQMVRDNALDEETRAIIFSMIKTGKSYADLTEDDIQQQINDILGGTPRVPDGPLFMVAGNSPLRSFMEGSQRNSYVRIGHYNVYLRKSQRFIDGKKYKMLDLANIQREDIQTDDERRSATEYLSAEDRRGAGKFKDTVLKVMAAAVAYNFDGVYAENVINPFLPDVLQRYGYIRDKNSDNLAPSFYLLRDQDTQYSPMFMINAKPAPRFSDVPETQIPAPYNIFKTVSSWTNSLEDWIGSSEETIENDVDGVRYEIEQLGGFPDAVRRLLNINRLFNKARGKVRGNDKWNTDRGSFFKARKELYKLNELLVRHGFMNRYTVAYHMTNLNSSFFEEESENGSLNWYYGLPDRFTLDREWLEQEEMNWNPRDPNNMMPMLGGPKAKTADQAILKYAKKRRSKKATRDEIWRETAAMGQPWMYDDGSWYFEDEDYGLRVASTGGKLMTAGEALSHPSGYMAYPQARKIGFKVTKTNKVSHVMGVFAPRSNRIEIKAPDGYARYVAAHEFQHRIDFYENRKYEWGTRQYTKRKSERRAMNVEFRADWSMKDRIRIPPWESEADAVAYIQSNYNPNYKQTDEDIARLRAFRRKYRGIKLPPLLNVRRSDAPRPPPVDRNLEEDQRIQSERTNDGHSRNVIHETNYPGRRYETMHELQRAIKAGRAPNLGVSNENTIHLDLKMSEQPQTVRDAVRTIIAARAADTGPEGRDFVVATTKNGRPIFLGGFERRDHRLWRDSKAHFTKSKTYSFSRYGETLNNVATTMAMRGSNWGGDSYALAEGVISEIIRYKSRGFSQTEAWAATSENAADNYDIQEEEIAEFNRIHEAMFNYLWQRVFVDLENARGDAVLGGLYDPYDVPMQVLINAGIKGARFNSGETRGEPSVIVFDDNSLDNPMDRYGAMYMAPQQFGTQRSRVTTNIEKAIDTYPTQRTTVARMRKYLLARVSKDEWRYNRMDEFFGGRSNYEKLNKIDLKNYVQQYGGIEREVSRSRRYGGFTYAGLTGDDATLGTVHTVSVEVPPNRRDLMTPDKPHIGSEGSIFSYIAVLQERDGKVFYKLEQGQSDTHRIKRFGGLASRLPMEETWPEEMVRVALTMAAQSNADGFSWNSGDIIRVIHPAYKGDIYDNRIPKYVAKLVKPYGLQVKSRVPERAQAFLTHTLLTSGEVRSLLPELYYSQMRLNNYGEKKISLIYHARSIVMNYLLTSNTLTNYWTVESNRLSVEAKAREIVGLLKKHTFYKGADPGTWKYAEEDLKKAITGSKKIFDNKLSGIVEYYVEFSNELKQNLEEGFPAFNGRMPMVRTTDPVRPFPRGMFMAAAGIPTGSTKSMSQRVQDELLRWQGIQPPTEQGFRQALVPGQDFIGRDPLEHARQIIRETPNGFDSGGLGRKLSVTMIDHLAALGRGLAKAAPTVADPAGTPLGTRLKDAAYKLTVLSNMNGQGYMLSLRAQVAGWIMILQDHIQRLTYLSERMSDTDYAEYGRYLLTRDADVNLITNPDVRAAAKLTKDLIDIFGQENVALGRMTARAYERYHGRYLPRKFFSDIHESLSNIGMRLGKGGYLRERLPGRDKQIFGALDITGHTIESEGIREQLGQLLDGVSSTDVVNAGRYLYNDLRSVHHINDAALRAALPGMKKRLRDMEADIDAQNVFSLKPDFPSGKPMPYGPYKMTKRYGEYFVGRAVFKAARKGLSIGGVLENDSQKALIEDPVALSAAAVMEQGRDLAFLHFMRIANIFNDAINDELGPGAPQVNWFLPDQMILFEGKSMTFDALTALLAEARNMQALNMTPFMRRIADRRIADMERLLRSHNIDYEKIGDEYTRLPNTPDYGHFRGLVVHRGISNLLQNMTGGQEENFITRNWVKGVSVFKQTQTTLNPKGHTRAIMQNIATAYFSGVGTHDVGLVAPSFNLGTWGWFIKALNRMQKGHASWEEFQRHGGKFGVFSTTELRHNVGLIRRLKMREHLANDDKLKMYHAIGSFFDSVKEGGADAFNFWDTWARYTKYIHEREVNKSAPGDAMVEAYEWAPDYTMVSEYVRGARNTVWPFLTFQYKLLPKFFDQLGRISGLMKDGITNGDAKKVGQAFNLLMRYAAPIMMWSGITSAAIAGLLLGAANMSDDEHRGWRRILSEYYRRNRGTIPVPFFLDERGEPLVLDLGPQFPWSQHISAIEHGFVEGDASKVMSDLGIGGPLPDIYTVFKTGQDPFTGYELVPPGATEAEKTLAAANYAFQTFYIPPTFRLPYGEVGHFAEHMGGDGLLGGGRQVEPAWATVSRLATGYNISTMNIGNQYLRTLNELTREKNELNERLAMANNDLVREIQGYNAQVGLSPEQRERRIAAANRRHARATEDYINRLQKVIAEITEYARVTGPTMDYQRRLHGRDEEEE